MSALEFVRSDREITIDQAEAEAVRRIAVARALHRPTKEWGWLTGAGPVCDRCMEPWPCATVSALEGQ